MSLVSLLLDLFREYSRLTLLPACRYRNRLGDLLSASTSLSDRRTGLCQNTRRYRPPSVCYPMHRAPLLSADRQRQDSYPAGHLYFYSLLNGLTADGANIRAAQYAFAAIYLATQAVVFAIYRLCPGVSIGLALYLVNADHPSSTVSSSRPLGSRCIETSPFDLRPQVVQRLRSYARILHCVARPVL